MIIYLFIDSYLVINSIIVCYIRKIGANSQLWYTECDVSPKVFDSGIYKTEPIICYNYNHLLPTLWLRVSSKLCRIP